MAHARLFYSLLLKKEREQKVLEERYPCLDPSHKQKYMTDRKILDKYIDLENSYLTMEERKEVMDILYKYREAFSLRDEIVTCPNIEVEIEVTDKPPFFYKTIPCERRRQSIYRERNEVVMLYGNIERRVLSIL